MIRNRTVLVLGAGASRPYDFPTGAELKRRIHRLVEQGGTNDHWRRSFDGCDFDWNDFLKFGKSLIQAPTGSVDAFLEARREFIPVGKHAIAYELTRNETPSRMEDIGGKFDSKNWYRWLFQFMTDEGVDNFPHNQLSVVTFNYDRSFEFFFINALMHGFGLSWGDARKLMGTIPIVHVHGQLGELIEVGHDENSRSYNTDPDPRLIRIAARGIRIVHEISDGSNELMDGYHRSHRILEKAETLLFLGFGFHPSNISRLMAIKCRSLIDPHGWGTYVGETESQIESIVRPAFKKCGLDFFYGSLGSEKSVLDFLRENVHLLVRV